MCVYTYVPGGLIQELGDSNADAIDCIEIVVHSYWNIHFYI